MKNLIEKDKKIRQIFNDYEVKKKMLNYISNNLYFDDVTVKEEKIRRKIRHHAYFTMYDLPKNSSLVRTRRRCVLTGRGRAVYRNFKLCRNMFRVLALKGDLPGVCKVSW